MKAADPLHCAIPAPGARTRQRLLCAAVATCVLAACATPRYETGERLYREGDRVAAMETWRAMEPGEFGYGAAQARIRAVEEEFEDLVVRYKRRARYFEKRGRLAESVLSYRLALRLQPDDRETLAHVQELVRTLEERRAEQRELLLTSLEAGDLAAAREAVAELRILDPFSPEAATDERALDLAFDAELERLLVRGRRSFTSGNLNAADATFRKALAMDPRNESAQGYLSYIARIRAEERDGALIQYGLDGTRGVDASDLEIRAEGFYQNALAAEAAGDPFAAIRFDVAALDAYPDHEAAARHLGSVRQRLQPDVEELLEAGRRHYQSEDLEGALDDWRRVLLIQPGNRQARDYSQRAERLLQNLDRLRDEELPRVGSGSGAGG
jgi:tetratricopeptide (TPR) repeat protein